MTIYESIKAAILVVLVAAICLSLHHFNKFIAQGQLTLQTYGKLGNESRLVVAQERDFLKGALPATLQLTNSALNNLNSTIQHVQQTTDDVGALAGSLRQTSQQATQTLATAQQGAQGIATAATETISSANVTVNKLGNAVGAAQQATQHLDTLVSGPAMQATIDNAATISTNLNRASAEGAGVLADTHTVTSKIATSVAQHTPWYIRLFKWM